MNLTKRKLLAILSLELLLYSFLYLPVFILLLISMSINEPTDIVQKLKFGFVIYAPPLLWFVVNFRMVRTLVRNARRDDRNREMMRFGAMLFGGQAGMIAVTLFSFSLLTILISGAAAISGLITAALMTNEEN